uniref:Uncharacterized protein n=1 Tax=Chromera velia CCMP2878 TaxID=1169474 RepID=A0A0G4HQY0_9ALVE|eukprot:Cvel_1270.t1-p1 / transcript=Cvel_1270.t1 / gene=Cvel_1270 / organism=Chromera_velia_CCMP2878 / gene_product=hypothetical protein / transcript_product=hypothetical protein / location=Cvel_scaffold42:141654-142343(-) / protein_length=173 / sequence_SO=supercontig / SO=protein_coding / is_pseudo=false
MLEEERESDWGECGAFPVRRRRSRDGVQASERESSPVVDTGASGHFFGEDVKHCVVEIREGEFEFVGVDGRVHRTSREVDVELAGVETARGGTETACLSGAYSRDKSVGPFRVCLNVEGGGDKGNKNGSPQPSSVSGSPQPSSMSSRQNGKGKAKEVHVSPAGWRKLRFPTEG